MNTLFSLVEPLPTTETLANYWHFLKSIDEKDREALGRILPFISDGAISRSPLERRMNDDDAKAQLLHELEELKKYGRRKSTLMRTQ